MTIVRHATARVMRLRVDPRDGAVRLTLPRRASLRRAYAWIEEQRPWVEAQLTQTIAGVRLVPGLVLDVAGEPVTLVAHGGRLTRRIGAVLQVGGDQDLFEARVLRWLRREALRVLTEETHATAAKARVTIKRVSVGDTRSRWGSCSAAGDIRYSWRLILAPLPVLRATVVHEVAHRVHMNHGPAFKALETELLETSPAPTRAWLRAHGASLHRYGRS